MDGEKKNAGRKSRAEWVELMSAYESGDRSQREFCKAHGVPYSSFGYWRRQLSAESRAHAAPLVELPAGFAERLTDQRTAATNGPWQVELELGSGAVLRIR